MNLRRRVAGWICPEIFREAYDAINEYREQKVEWEKNARVMIDIHNDLTNDKYMLVEQRKSADEKAVRIRHNFAEAGLKDCWGGGVSITDMDLFIFALDDDSLAGLRKRMRQK